MGTAQAPFLRVQAARSARAKGQGDPAPVPQVLWTPLPPSSAGAAAPDPGGIAAGRHLRRGDSQIARCTGTGIVLCMTAALDKQQANGWLSAARATEGMKDRLDIALAPERVPFACFGLSRVKLRRLSRTGGFRLKLRKESFCRVSLLDFKKRYLLALLLLYQIYPRLHRGPGAMPLVVLRGIQESRGSKGGNRNPP